MGSKEKMDIQMVFDSNVLVNSDGTISDGNQKSCSFMRLAALTGILWLKVLGKY